MKLIAGKPIVKVYLLPKRPQEGYKKLFDALVEAAKSLSALNVESEKDLVVLFIPDLMLYGLGTEIVIEVDVPRDLDINEKSETLIAKTIGEALKREFPEAYVQCKVYAFDAGRGFYAG